MFSVRRNNVANVLVFENSNSFLLLQNLKYCGTIFVIVDGLSSFNINKTVHRINFDCVYVNKFILTKESHYTVNIFEII